MTENNKVRRIRYSIGVKLGIFVGMILIVTMIIVGIFIVRQQKATLHDNLKHSMHSYLQSFKKVVQENLRLKEDISPIQSYTVSLTNIANLHTAMFVDLRGRVFSHATWYKGRFDGRYAVKGMDVPKLTDSRLIKKYKDIGFLLSDVVKEDEPKFIQSARFTPDEFERIEDNVAQENRKIKEKNKTKAVKKKQALRKLPANPSYFEGFLPVYVNFFTRINRYDRTLSRGMGIFQRWGRVQFKYKGRQSRPRMRDLSFINLFERLYNLIYQEVKKDGRLVKRELRRYGKYLIKRKKDALTQWESNYIVRYLPYLRNYRKGYYGTFPIRVFTARFQKMAAKIFKKVYGKRLKGKKYDLVSLADQAKLFRQPLGAGEKKELTDAVTYVQIAEKFMGIFSTFHDDKVKKLFDDMYKTRIQPFKQGGDAIFFQLRSCKQYFEKYLKTGVFTLPSSHYYAKLAKTYKPRSSPEERAEFFKHVFRVLVTPFKFGYVRIILNPRSIKRDLDKVTFRTVDLSVSLILRMIFITFLLSSLMVRNIKRLAEGATAVGQGNFETRIDLSTSDELGQLADRFNIMVSDIKDKFRMQIELKDAEVIQKFLIPDAQNFPEVPGYAFAGYYDAQTEAGGDYYDFIEVGKDHFGLVSADVSGHGVGSGLVMTMVRAVLRSQALGKADAREVLSLVNPQIFKDTLPAMFATALYVTVNYKKHLMYYASAGHDPAILYNTISKELKMLPADGIPLGMADGETFNSIIQLKKQPLKKGDILLLYTDGITEAMNDAKEEYQEERLCAAVKKYGKKPLDKMLQLIVDDVKKFTNHLPQEDDISLLAMKVLE